MIYCRERQNNLSLEYKTLVLNTSIKSTLKYKNTDKRICAEFRVDMLYMVTLSRNTRNMRVCARDS
jgi:hypothetical protein